MSCTADGSLAATGCNDGAVIIWDLAAGRRLSRVRHPSPLCGLRFSPDGKLLAASYTDGQVIFWNPSDWSQTRTLPADGNATSIGALAFSPDSRLLATGNQAGAGTVWNVSSGAQVMHFAGYENPEASPSPPVAPVFPGSVITPENRNAILFLCFSADGATIFGALQDNAPRVWEAKTGAVSSAPRKLVRGHALLCVPRYGFTFSSAAFTPQRDTIVTMKENLAQVWRLSFAPSPPQ